MAPEYDPENLYTLTDETGKEQTFELLDVMDVQGRRYFALTPFYPDAQVRLISTGAKTLRIPWAVQPFIVPLPWRTTNRLSPTITT